MILGSDLGRDKRFISSPKHPDQLWGLHSLPYMDIRILSRD